MSVRQIMNVHTTDVDLWIKFNIIPLNSKMFSKMTIVSFKKVLKNIYKNFHNICSYQLKIVEHFKKVNFCVLYDIFNFLGILYNCVNIFLEWICYTKRSLKGYYILMYFCDSYASNLNGMRYVVWMSVRDQWNRPTMV